MSDAMTLSIADIQTRPFTMVYNDFLDSDLLNRNEKLLFVVLKRFGEKAFPSLKTLAYKMGVSKSTVQRTIRSLIDKKLLIKKARKSKIYGNRSNIYIIKDSAEFWKENKVNVSDQEQEQETKTSNNNISDDVKKAFETIKKAGYKVIGKEIAENQINMSRNEKELATNTTSNKQAPIHKPHICLNNSKSNEKNQVFNESYSVDDLKALYNYHNLILDFPNYKEDIEIVLNMIHTALNTQKKYFYVNSAKISAETFKSVLSKLDGEEIIYAIDKFNSQKNKIDRPESYMLTLLYKAHNQIQLEFKNLGHFSGDF